ncbi:MAG: hypothetical protein FRX49_02002 [Trebouxia sp. A1-2]|nr:MAG: hypothetical protein FRX49_02002 [Trebouxia sp. A1-2]
MLLSDMKAASAETASQQAARGKPFGLIYRFAQLVLPAEQHCWHHLQLQRWLHPGGPARTAQKPSELTRQMPALTQEADSGRGWGAASISPVIGGPVERAVDDHRRAAGCSPLQLSHRSTLRSRANVIL